jgi:hypothetical protein
VKGTALKLLLLIGAIVLFIIVAILCFAGSVALGHVIGLLAIGAAAFAASFLPIP